LSEAECYARCYGARDERVSVLRGQEEPTRPAAREGSQLRALVEQHMAELSEQDGQEAA
jgi:hypothetical protein